MNASSSDNASSLMLSYSISSNQGFISTSPGTLQRQFRLYIPFLGIARPQPQFLHSCVCERFIYSQDRSTYFLQQKRQLHHGNTLFANRHMNVEIGLRPRYSFSGNICFKFLAFSLCSVFLIWWSNAYRSNDSTVCWGEDSFQHIGHLIVRPLGWGGCIQDPSLDFV